MNWVDLIIIFIFLIFIWDGIKRGFLRHSWELLGLVLAFFVALTFYGKVSDAIISYYYLTGLNSLIVSSVVFVSLALIVQIITYYIGRLLSFYTPGHFKESKINSAFGPIPAVLKGLMFVSITLVVLLSAPIDPIFKNLINKSYLGNRLVNSTAQAESKLEALMIKNQSKSLTYWTNVSQEEQTPLNFSTTSSTIDSDGEKKLLELTNNERAKENLPPLALDPLIRNVARVHSRDMLLRGYFSHNSTDGKGLFERLMGANVAFNLAAENIALAPTIDLAHLGLMNSPKHKENIMNPQFTRVGIGIIDAGPYGLMVTEDFAN